MPKKILLHLPTVTFGLDLRGKKSLQEMDYLQSLFDGVIHFFCVCQTNESESHLQAMLRKCASVHPHLEQQLSSTQQRVRNRLSALRTSDNFRLE